VFVCIFSVFVLNQCKMLVSLWLIVGQGR